MNVINWFFRSNEIRIKSNTQDCFEILIAEFIQALEKLFLKFEESRLRIDEQICKKS